MKAVAPKPLTISEVTRRIKSVLESQPELSDVLVTGEISNFTHHGSGHMYFSLKDEGAQIRAVMFRSSAEHLDFRPEEGLSVEALGTITVYERRGEYQIVVRAMRPAGMGALFIEFEKLKKKLAVEGLFDPDRKRPIPAFPRHIAVVTSLTGAAVRDVIKVISRRCPAVRVTLIPTLVQGIEAPASVIHSLDLAARLPDVDVLLLVRGGGSIEDLWAFNDEKVARAIAAHPVPVVSGVGHETDFTIADFVADLRAPTPSAAAEIVTPDLSALRRQLVSQTDALRRALLGRVRISRAELNALVASVSIARLRDRINQMRQDVDALAESAGRTLRHRIELSRGGIALHTEKLRALDPHGILSRGYAIVSDAASGRLIRTTALARPGRDISVRVTDGTFHARVEVPTRQADLSFDD